LGDDPILNAQFGRLLPPQTAERRDNVSKAPFGIIIKARLKPGSTLAAKDLVSKIAGGLKTSAQGTKYWGYSVATGPGEVYYVFAPFVKYADLDRPTVGDVVAKASSNLDVDGVITALEGHVEEVGRTIVEYVPALSNPPTAAAPAPGPYVYHVEATLKPGHTIEARDLAAQIAAAYNKNAKAPKYWGYMTAAGLAETYHVFLPFNKYADIDSWPTTGEILAGGNVSNVDGLITSLDGMIEYTGRTILEYIPGLSNPA
jgi:uncharacterized Zn-binding protein involved in type VI secretion